MLDGVEERSAKNKVVDHSDMTEELKAVEDQLVKRLKTKLFVCFYNLNRVQFDLEIQYHVLIILIEAFQLLSLLVNDGEHS